MLAWESPPGLPRFKVKVQEKSVRLFVALDLPSDVRATLSELCARLQKTCPAANWARLDGVHITLKFIGYVAAEQSERIRQALASLPAFLPIELRFAGLGFFPNSRRPRVFWAGVQASPDLAALAAAIEAKLEPLGIPAEKREFRPHITLARFESPKGAHALSAAVEALGTPEFGAATLQEFHLYQSVLKRSGAEYTRLVTYPLRRELAP